jgi:putative spermidine/putrescine transport system ATP-binding protein
MTAIIEARQLQKHYGGPPAVRDVSFAVTEGEFLSLLGASGSGKTTTLRMIAGLETPTQGAVLFRGQDITNVPVAKRDMRMVFQDFALFPNLTVWENVAFGLRLRINRGRVTGDQVKTRVGQYLETVQLSGHAEKMPHQLSGGQRQRVSLARALVTDPPVVLFDEPLGSLDANMRKVMQLELKRLHRELRKTFIYVTHDQEEALSMSDRIAILRGGRLVQLGRPAELYERPATTFVADFLGKSNFIAAIVEGIHADHFTYRLGEARFAQLGDGVLPAAGERVMLALRPEKMSVTTTPAAHGNSLSGEIVASSYLGTSLHLRVRTGEVGDMVVTVPAWRLAIPPESGRQVWLSWDRDASVVVHPD